MGKKYVKKKKEPEIYILSHRVHRTLSQLSLLTIPILAIRLINKFSFEFLIFSIIISGILSFLYWWSHNYKIIMYDDKVIIHNLINRVFEINKIQSLSLKDFGYIGIMYDDRVYIISGFIDWGDFFPIEKKNKEILGIINAKVMKFTKKNMIFENNDLITIADKSMRIIWLIAIFLLFGFIFFISLLSDWNIVLFCITSIIVIICIIVLIFKISSPEKILLYDSKHKILIINKLFKTIEIEINKISNFNYSYKSNFVTIKLKNKKRIFILGIRNIRYAVKKLFEIKFGFEIDD